MEDAMVLPNPAFSQLIQAIFRIAEIRQFELLLEQIMFQALELFDAWAGYLIFIGDEGVLDYRVRRDRKGILIQPLGEDVGQLIHKQVLLPRKLWITPDSAPEAGILMAAPLIAHGRLLGAFYLRHCAPQEQGEFIMQQFAAYCALAIENGHFNDRLETISGENREAYRRMKEELERLSMMDPLTGISNHRHFYELGEQICAVPPTRHMNWLR
jgi:GAF domain-containing protein